MIPNTINVKNCIECKGDHEDLETIELSEEDVIVVGDEVYTHYIVCPVTKRVIYVCQRESN